MTTYSIIQKSQQIAIFNNPEKLSAVISLIVAIIILIVSFFQWWNITWDGKMVTKRWIKTLFVVLIISLVTALALILL